MSALEAVVMALGLLVVSLLLLIALPSFPPPGLGRPPSEAVPPVLDLLVPLMSQVSSLV